MKAVIAILLAAFFTPLEGVSEAAGAQEPSSEITCDPRGACTGPAVPKPKRKPALAAFRQTGAPNPPVASDSVLSEPAQIDEGRIAAQAAADCQDELRELGAEFSIPPMEVTAPACRVAAPVRLRSISTSLGAVELPAGPILDCIFARQFLKWITEIAAPVVAGLSESKLEAFSTGPGFQCRVRTGDSSGKISEHALGNAIDIDGLILADGKRIEIPDVSNESHPNHRVLTALRRSACGYFTTVLGPGSNAAHESHFHFDLGRHGKSGDYRICE
ncbi:MAG TPA: extensin family protein [Aestuariivirgaceae bacterium]|jgi:hypothetical protein